MEEKVAALFSLDPIERAKHYREYAEEFRTRAANAITEETRREYLRMAVDWLDMAERLEAEYGKVSVAVDAPELAALLGRVSS